MITEAVNKDVDGSYTMPQVKSKMQALQKQYRDIVNAKCATGNTKTVYKPDYWEDMLLYFACRDGLSGQSIVNSNATKDFLDITTENKESKSELITTNEEETQDDEIQVTQVTQILDLEIGGAKAQKWNKEGEDFETLSKVERKQSAPSPANSSVLLHVKKGKIDVGTSISSLGKDLKDGMHAMATSLANQGNNQALVDHITNNQKELIEVIWEQGQKQNESLLQIGTMIANVLQRTQDK